MGYIYKITNNINGKCYIGKTERTINVRWSEHIRLSRLKLDLPLYRAFLKYGVENFSIEEVEQCNNTVIDEREIYWIDYFNSYKNGYNCTAGGEGGIKTHEEYIDIIIERYLNGERLNLYLQQAGHYVKKAKILEQWRIILVNKKIPIMLRMDFYGALRLQTKR